MAWLPVEIHKESNDKIFQPQSICSQADKDIKKDPFLLNSRRMHKICSVWDEKYYQQLYTKNSKEVSAKIGTLARETRMDRHIWCNKRSDIIYEEGLYVFGGMDEQNVLSNDLYLLKPDVMRNKALISRIEGDFHDKNPRYSMILKKIDNYKG